MFIILLRFAQNKARAGDFMEGHKAWIQRGIDDGVFLLVGGLQPSAGGAILAHDTSMPALQARILDDPFVEQSIVDAEILQVAPASTDARLDFLMA